MHHPASDDADIVVVVVVVMATEVDDLAQYLDGLLTSPQSKVTISSIKGGLNRFRATANRTREMASTAERSPPPSHSQQP